jgi:threonine dehydratase
MPTAADIVAARPAVEAIARRTPMLTTRTISERAGGHVVLKAENLQLTGSFKIRGCSAKLAALGDRGCANGVITASAGNHAQALAAAAAARGVRCEVHVPGDAPIAKVEAARSHGAVVHIGGESVIECLDVALARAAEENLAFVHPFDDEEIVSGQGSLGLELVEDVPDLARVVIPLGGGGLLAGAAIAIKAARPEVTVVGVQAEACAAYLPSLEARTPVAVASSVTIADGIAVKRPGAVTLPLVEEWVDEVVTVDEDAIAEAMVLLMERCKLVVEGAGAVGVAALVSGTVRPAPSGTTVAVLSGGNVDVTLLGSIGRRHETLEGRRLVLMTRISDRPGGLAALLGCVAELGANVVDVAHVREGVDLHVRETAVDLVLETRGRDHAGRVLAALRDAGYDPVPLRG